MGGTAAAGTADVQQQGWEIMGASLMRTTEHAMQPWAQTHSSALDGWRGSWYSLSCRAMVAYSPPCAPAQARARRERHACRHAGRHTGTRVSCKCITAGCLHACMHRAAAVAESKCPTSPSSSASASMASSSSATMTAALGRAATDSAQLRRMRSTALAGHPCTPPGPGHMAEQRVRG